MSLVAALKETHKVTCVLVVVCLLVFNMAHAKATEWQIVAPDFSWHIAKGAQYIEDTNAKFVINDIISGAAQKKLQAIQGTSINFGYSDSAFWIKVPIENRLDQAIPLIASVDYSLLDEVDFYWVQNSRVIQSTLKGDARPLTNQKYDVPHYVDEFTLTANSQSVLWVRVKSQSALSVPLYVVSSTRFIDKVSAFKNVEGAFYGLAIGLLFYNLFLLVMLKERVYFEYVLFVSVHVSFQYFLTGYTQFSFSEYPYLYERGVYVVGVISGICLYQFSRTYLNTPKEAPVVDKILRLYIAFAVVMFFVESFAPLSIAIKVNVLTVFFGCVLLFIVGFIRLFSGYKSARYFLVGQGGVLASVMFTALASRHIVPGYEMAPLVMKLGAVIEMLFFSIGLADRINRFKEAEAILSAKATKADAENAARKRYINQINSINKELENAVKSRSEFLANMSHEIRTPMNGILGMLELIDDKKLDSIERNYVEIARRSGKTLLDLINDVLDLSKIEADKLELESVNISLKEFVQDLQHLYRHQLLEQGLELQIELDQSLPPAILGDRTRLWQILTNLTSNAIKFTHKGHVAISIKKEATDSGDQIRFAVRDTGIGIPKEKQSAIFESFTQADGSTTRQYGGTGLGLTISRKLIEKMGGELQLDSTPGVGSCFYFSIPLQEGQVTAKVVDNAGDQFATDLAGISVLLVEDNVVNQKVAQGMLKKLGIENVDLCENGADAVAAISRKHYDVVLMDVQMPVMDGFEAAKTVRDEERQFSRKRQLIIAMTAHSMEGDRELCLQSGMDDYIAKPIQKAELQAVLSKHIVKNIDSSKQNKKRA